MTYDGNGKTGGTIPAAQTKIHDVDLTLAANTGSLVKTGYTFSGWNTAADGSGTDYAPGAGYTRKAGVTLYARWTAGTYILTVNSGIVSGSYACGEVVTISASAPSMGQVFDQWAGDTAQVANIYLPNTMVTMPDADVTVTALYKDAEAATWALTVTNGAGDGDYTAGEMIALTADTPPLGQVFDRWTGDTETVANTQLSGTTLIMPSAAVAVTATYKDPGVTMYTLTVTSGTGDGDYLSGTVIAISADPPVAGQVFDQWRTDTGTIENINLPDTTLIMPKSAAAVAAVYKDEKLTPHALSATHGSGSGDYLAGRVVAISATIPAGYTFVQWSGQTAWVTDIYQADTTMVMSGADVAVNAVNRPDTYTLTYTAGGNGSITGTTSQTVNHGTDGSPVSAVPDAGYHFVQWSDGSTDNPRTDSVVTRDISVWAMFTLTVVTDLDTDGDGIPDYQDTDDDNDGIDDIVEAGAPNNGDGNHDGLADFLQANVVSLLAYGTGEYVTLESSPGTVLSDCRAMAPPAPEDVGIDGEFPWGLFGFIIGNLPVGGSAWLEIYLPEDAFIDTYMKYGPTPHQSTDHWCSFMYDDLTGAEIDGNIIMLYFEDASRGDGDLAFNGQVVNLGGPVLLSGTNLSEESDGGDNNDDSSYFMGSLFF